jgi:hypothetical protein
LYLSRRSPSARADLSSDKERLGSSRACIQGNYFLIKEK